MDDDDDDDDEDDDDNDCSFRTSWYIKSLVTPTNAQFYKLCLFSIT
jgi:hypothetical protein